MYPPPTRSTTSRIPELTLPNIPVFRILVVYDHRFTHRSVTSRGSTPLKIIIYDLLYTAIAENFFQRSIPLAHTSDRLSNSPRRVILRRKKRTHFFPGPESVLSPFPKSACGATRTSLRGMVGASGARDRGRNKRSVFPLQLF